MRSEHVINFEKAKEIETELGLLSLNTKRSMNNKMSKVVFYCPFNQSFTQMEQYETKEIMSLLNSYQKENFFIIQIDNDYNLYEELLKLQFKSDFENIYKLFDLKLDYCFSPIDGLLCFNLSVLTSIDCDEIEKFLIQIFLTENGLYIINKDDCDNILNIFKKKFNFNEQSKEVFFQKAFQLGGKANCNINTQFQNLLPIRDTQLRLSNKKINNEIYEEQFTNFLNSTAKESPEDYYFLQQTKEVKDFSNIICQDKMSTDNFSTDDLIYYLLVMSLDKLEEFAESLVKEAESLKGIYLELSEKERKDFFRRIHNMEISLQLIYGETVIKKKFLKYSKAQFKVYNKLSQNFYFKKTFNFFIELMISKVTHLEITFEKLENTIRMIKENYSIIIEDNTEKQNIKLNSVMKVLAIISTLYVPLNLLPNIFGMNVKLPMQDVDNYWPFFGILGIAISLVVILLLIFKKLKWLED